MSLSRTSKLLSQLDQHFGKCAVLAAAGVGAGMVSAPQTAEAAIVHNAAANLTIASTTNGLYLNVVNYPAPGSINEPGNTAGGTVPGWDINPWGSGTALNYFNPSAPAGGVYVQRTGGGATANLPAGTLIDGASLYGGSAAATTGATPHLLNSDQNLIGFRFQDETAQCVKYGWFRVSLSGTLAAQPRTLVEYAYENECGVGIAAGVPEPGSLALLAMGAAGMLIRRRK